MMYTDQQIIKAIVEENQTVFFEMLYDRYAQRIYNTCLYYTKVECEAEDLTQDIFVKLFLNLNKFKGNSKFSTWLYSFCKNHCINYLRRNNSKKINKNNLHYLDIDHLNLSDDTDSDDNIEFRVDELRIAMDTLSNNDKTILLLKYRESMSIKEIGQQLNIGESAVKMRLSRAKSQLKTVMPVAV